jgi:hypothetical protein
MALTRIASFCGILGLVFGMVALATPASAGCPDHSGRCWWQAHHLIYHMEDRIAFLEANPDVDDGYKGPVIDQLHRKVRRIRAVIGPRWPHWPSPCCYSRRPIHIR